jgi:hypothetical protein
MFLNYAPVSFHSPSSSVEGKTEGTSFLSSPCMSSWRGQAKLYISPISFQWVLLQNLSYLLQMLRCIPSLICLLKAGTNSYDTTQNARVFMNLWRRPSHVFAWLRLIQEALICNACFVMEIRRFRLSNTSEN